MVNSYKVDRYGSRVALLSRYRYLVTFSFPSNCNFTLQKLRYFPKRGMATYPSFQCCGSGMFVPDPGSKNSSKREWWKKICCQTFFCNLKFHIIENYFIFEMLKKKIWANFQRIIELFTQKIVTKLSKIWVRNPGSEIRVVCWKQPRLCIPTPSL